MNASKFPIRIGCSGWSYPDWEGPFYPDGTDPGDFLEYYADRFPVVEVDSTFYRPPTPKMVRAWRDRTPDDFKFALKVPKVITHEKRLVGCDDEIRGFVSAIRPLGDRAMVALLQMGYFNRAAFASLDDFLAALGPFLKTWPREIVPLAVEIRNPRWVGEPLLNLLREHDASFVLTDQTWMPRPAEIVAKHDVLTGPLGFIRLLGDREGMEKVTTTWGKVVVDKKDALRETAGVVRSMSDHVPVLVFVTNHYAGHSPETARQLRALLGLPEPPAPPERAKTTLF
jgi:uncharacterized protein YecE (DUF72 family)